MSDGRRRALVTGGSSGIGRGIALALARDGCDVGIFYQGKPEDAEPVRASVESHGRRFWSRVGDVRDSAQVNAAVESFQAEFGGIEILINCAGILRDGVVWKLSDEQWREVIDVNLTGVFHFARAVAPAMRKSGWGAIVNMSSINGLRGKFGQTNYSAAKAGVIGLTKALAKELAKFNVTVNAIAPGMIATPMTESLPKDALEGAISEILLGRIGSVADIAEMAAYLCSDKGRFITGEVIRIDGGQYI